MAKSRVCIIFLLLCLVAGSASDANGQFWKKKKHERKHGSDSSFADKNASEISREKRKELRRKERLERKKLRKEQKLLKKKKQEGAGKSAATPTPGLKKKTEVAYPSTKMLQRYRIDVLASLYLDDLAKGTSVAKDKIPEKSLSGVAFYQGIKIAADSLKRAGFNIDIYIHDAASALESVHALVSKNSLDSSNLIIGAVQSKDIPELAAYAKKKHINFISALSAADASVKNNEYFTIIQPTLKSHCEWIAEDVRKKFPKQKVVLLYRKSNQVDESAYKYITESADKLDLRQFPCTSVPRRKSLLPYFDTTKPNVVIVPILDDDFADSLLHQINEDFPGTHFEVYGMPSWVGIDNLRKKKSYPNLSVNISYPFNFDPSTPLGQYIIRTCKRDYGTAASELVFRGYETLYWYASLLRQYGTIFNPKYADNTAAPFTKFEVKTVWDKDGTLLFQENKHIFLTTYDGGNYKIK